MKRVGSELLPHNHVPVLSVDQIQELSQLTGNFVSFALRIVVVKELLAFLDRVVQEFVGALHGSKDFDSFVAEELFLRELPLGVYLHIIS